MRYLILTLAALIVGVWQLLKWAERKVNANPYLAFTFPTDADLSPDVFMTDYNFGTEETTLQVKNDSSESDSGRTEAER